MTPAITCPTSGSVPSILEEFACFVGDLGPCTGMEGNTKVTGYRQSTGKMGYGACKTCSARKDADGIPHDAVPIVSGGEGHVIPSEGRQQCLRHTPGRAIKWWERACRLARRRECWLRGMRKYFTSRVNEQSPRGRVRQQPSLAGRSRCSEPLHTRERNPVAIQTAAVLQIAESIVNLDRTDDKSRTNVFQTVRRESPHPMTV